MSDLVKIARTYVPFQTTHFDGCEREHIECLVQRMADEIKRLTAERDEARAERDALAKQGETLQALVDACKLLSSEAEEYEFDDGLGRGALLDYWYEFDRKLDAAIDAQIEQERSDD